jgi:SAM-dependent methyltransferase
VTGIDRDERSIRVARAHPDSADVDYRCGDFLDLALEPGRFDLVTAVASLHHMDSAAALARMREQLRPGGVLVVIGPARDGSLVDLALNIPAAADHESSVSVTVAGHRAASPSESPDRPWTISRSSARRRRPINRSVNWRPPCCRDEIPPSPALALLGPLDEAGLNEHAETTSTHEAHRVVWLAPSPPAAWYAVGLGLFVCQGVDDRDLRPI